MWREVTFMRALRHPNIISLYSYFIVSPEREVVDQWKELQRKLDQEPAAASASEFVLEQPYSPEAALLMDSSGSDSDSKADQPKPGHMFPKFKLCGEDVFVIIMEYANAGNLYKEMMRYPSMKIPVPGVRYYLKQILDGVRYIHDKGIRHNDIHSENIFMSFNPDVRTKRCKIADEFDPRTESPTYDISQVCYLLEGMLTGFKLTEFTILKTPEREICDRCSEFTNAGALMAHPWFQRTTIAPVPPAKVSKPAAAPAYPHLVDNFPKRKMRRLARQLPTSNVPDPIFKPKVSATESSSRGQQPSSSRHASGGRKSSPSTHDEKIEALPPMGIEGPDVRPDPSTAPSWQRRVRRSVSSLGRALRHRIGSLNCFHGNRHQESHGTRQSESRSRQRQ